jgi:hypothetical protein
MIYRNLLSHHASDLDYTRFVYVYMLCHGCIIWPWERLVKEHTEMEWRHCGQADGRRITSGHLAVPYPGPRIFYDPIIYFRKTRGSHA